MKIYSFIQVNKTETNPVNSNHNNIFKKTERGQLLAEI